MKGTFKVALAATFFSSLLFMTSCKKEGSQYSNVSESEAITVSQENTEADADYDDLTEIGFSAGADMQEQGSLGNEVGGGAAGRITVGLNLLVNLEYKIGPCTTVEVSSMDSVYPKTITIDYGAGCLCRDGKFRKGMIELNLSGPIRKAGSEMTITLHDYYVNRKHIEGTKTITNLSANGALIYSVKVEGGKVTFPNGRGFSFEGIKTFTQIEGMSTARVADDVFSIEGNNKTVYNSGLTVTRRTESPLIKPVACNWIVKGVLKVVVNERTFYIDFGQGNCDNKAILKWAAGEKEITLP